MRRAVTGCPLRMIAICPTTDAHPTPLDSNPPRGVLSSVPVRLSVLQGDKAESSSWVVIINQGLPSILLGGLVIFG